MSGSFGNGRDERPEDAEVQDGAAAAADEPRADEPREPADASGAGPEQTALQEVAPTLEELETLRREREELKDQLLRRRADYENFRRRAEREQQAAATEAAAATLRRFLETVDNLERALAAQRSEEGLREGVELTLRDLRSALEAHEVRVVDPQGERFDPQHHQALLHEDAPGFAAGTVAQVFRKGYLYKDRLLRPALVKVASGESPAPVDAGGAGEVQ